MFGSSTTWDRSTTHSKFDPTRVQTHDLQIMTVHVTETPSHKPWRKIEVTICKITRLTAHFMYVLMSGLVICELRKIIVIHNTECPY